MAIQGPKGTLVIPPLSVTTRERYEQRDFLAQARYDDISAHAGIRASTVAILRQFNRQSRLAGSSRAACNRSSGSKAARVGRLARCRNGFRRSSYPESYLVELQEPLALVILR